MMTHIRPALAMLVAMILLTGLAYPLAMTGLARAVAPGLSQGSLVERDGRIVGSALVGQQFAGPGYLHPRPSAVDYATMPGGASNLGLTSAQLKEQVAGRRATYEAQNGAGAPADAVTTSASGLDPDISPENAQAQAARIAGAHGIDTAIVQQIIRQHVTRPLWGLYGQSRVNVLRTNLALDLAAPMPPAGAD
ncbi:potassium-transporting ATPase subunit KdpC (plasmid) [Paracoccus ferrooxidans]|nr:potassium-transporting ATPase subunit KdpC [Paracoccus ferrooxidans]